MNYRHMWEVSRVLFGAFLIFFGSTSDGFSWSKERIVVVGDSSYAPFEFKDAAGEAQGIAVDIWKLWSATTGVEIDYRLMAWDDALAQVQNGEADAVGGLFFSEERAKRFDYSIPYTDIKTHIFFHKDILGLTGLQSLLGFSIGVIKGDFAEDYVRENLPGGQILAFDGYESMIQAAVAGKIRVFVGDTPVVLFTMAKFGVSQAFRHTADPLYSNTLYVGVRKNIPGLLALVNRGFSKITRKDMEDISKKWTGVTIQPPLPLSSMWLDGLLVGSLLVFFMVLWGVRLRNRSCELPGWGAVTAGFALFLLAGMTRMANDLNVFGAFFIFDEVSLVAVSRVAEVLVGWFLGFLFLTWGIVQIVGYVYRLRDSMEESEKTVMAGKESLEMFEYLFSVSPDVLMIADLAGDKFVEVNENATRVLGFSRRELLSMGPNDLDALGDPLPAVGLAERMEKANGAVIDHNFRRKGGGSLQMAVTTKRIQGQGNGARKMLILARSLTLVKRMREQLEAVRREQERTQRLGGLGSWELSLDNEKVQWSDEFFILLGLAPDQEEARHETLLELVHPEDLSVVQNAFDKARLSPQGAVNIDFRVVRPDQKERILRMNGERFVDRNDPNGAIAGILQDVTARVSAERTLRETTCTLDTVLSAARNLGIAIASNELKILYFNRASEEIFGYSADKVLGKTVIELHADEGISPARTEEGMVQLRRTGRFAYSTMRKIGGVDVPINIQFIAIQDPELGVIGTLLLSERQSEPETSKAGENQGSAP